MSAPSISAQQVAAKYAEFNGLFGTTLAKPTVSQAEVRQLLMLRLFIERTAISPADFQTKDPLFPEKIKTRELLLADLKEKVEAIRVKCIKVSGAWNMSHNCWLTAGLQVMQHIPHLRQALVTVGEFYSQGNSFESVKMQTVADKIAIYMQNPEQNQLLLEQAKEHYKGITYDIFRLRTFQLLTENQIPPAVLAHFPLPHHYNQRIRSLAKISLSKITKPTSDQVTLALTAARKHVLKTDEGGGYTAKEDLLKKCGADLLATITAFDQAAAQNRFVPGMVVQNVRMALHYLSQSRLSNGTLNTSFSPSATVSEDSNEGILKIMSEFERILKLRGTPVPPAYFPIETIRSWVPDPASPLEPHDPTRSRLILGRYSSETLHDHQILVTVPKQAIARPDLRPMHLEELLKQNCRHLGTESQKYQHPDGQVQLFTCTDVRQVIHGAPEQLSFVLNRFIHDIYGQSKNYFNVRVPRFMTLPAQMTTVSKPLAYNLKAVVEHSGTITRGHYITYINVEGQWIKCDDEVVTLLTDLEMDILLNKTVGHKTPYYFYYSKVPDNQQQDMLRLAANMRAQAARAEKEATSLTSYDHSKLLELLEEISKLLKNPTPAMLKWKEAIEVFKAQYPEYMKMLHLLLSLDSGAEDTPEKVDDTPEQLGKVLKKWISSTPKQNAVEQLITYVSKEKEYSDLERTSEYFEHLMTLLFSEGTEEEFMEQFERLSEIQQKIQKALPVEEGEELTFEGAMKYGTLRTYIRDKMTKDVNVNLSSIGQELREKIENKKKTIHAHHIALLFARIQDGASAKQILKMFEAFDFPPEVKNSLYLEVCKAGKKPEDAINADTGRRLFEQNPLILGQPIVPHRKDEPASLSETIAGRLILELAPKVKKQPGL